MKGKLCFSLSVFVAVIVAGLLPAGAQAGPDGITAYEMNVRAGPGTGFGVIAQLPAGTGLIFEGRNADGSWLLVHTVDGTVRGWVASLYVQFQPGVTAARFPVSGEVIGAAAPAPADPAPAAGGPMTGVLTANLNMRRGPGRDQAVILRLAAGSTVTLEARSADSVWVFGQYGDARGWMALDYVRLSGELASLPVGTDIIQQPEPPEIQRLRQTPVVASATGRARDIYQRGLARGNHPNRFSKVGDCQSVTSFFLGPFDRGEYRLGDQYAYLQPTIDYFAGSFGRDSAAVWSGFNIYAILDPTWANPARCASGESPQACEYREWQPSFVIISLEVWNGRPEDYESNLRQVLDFWIGKDVVPILATKPSNREGNWAINAIIARVGQEYDIPLWNFLMATQPLRDFGLTDGFHLSYAQNLFDDPGAMANAWPWRNLT
ncbi:MAG: SH3 domain-containing protein, partial [Anaerolineae bacterium]|nr:SH3 domain-containing protein [Anaerolineae bacterium]